MPRYHARKVGSTTEDGDEVPLRAFGPDGTASNPASMETDRTGSLGTAADFRIPSPIEEAKLEDDEEDCNYLTGVKLLMVMASISMIMLLAFLDTAILGTVSERKEKNREGGLRGP